MFVTGIGTIEFILILVLGLGLMVYLITLATRLVRALERIAEKMEK